MTVDEAARHLLSRLAGSDAEALDVLLSTLGQPREQHCGHRYARLGGMLTSCTLGGGHDGAHDNGRGVLWSRGA